MGYQEVRFPKGTRFLVTGAAGFIGSNLVEALLRLGCEVRGLDNFSTGRRENIKEFEDNDRFELIEGDIRDFETCLAAWEDVDYVLHQAALGSVSRSVEEPLIYEDNNIKGTSNMMEAARQRGVRRFVYASSSSVYGDSTELPKVEGREGRACAPYALTKKVNELYGELYTRLYGLECIGLRYFNVFGPKQNPESEYAAVIPKFIRALKAGSQVEIYGDGEQSRDFTYVENVVEANLKACIAPKEASGEVYNIAFGQRFTINQLYDLLCKFLEVDLEPRYLPTRTGDVRHSQADISRAKKILGYDPEWNLVRGLSEAIEWYGRHV